MKRIKCVWWVHLVVPLYTIDQQQAFVSSFPSLPHPFRGTFNEKKKSIQRIVPSNNGAFCTNRSNSASSTSRFSQDGSDAIALSLESKDCGESTPMKLPLTNAILRISYDGSRFTGWSAANGKNDQSLQQPRRRKPFHEAKLPAGFVRSVEGILKENLAKLYGDVDPNTRIVVEGCSRTDKGVHATCMIAQVYCLKEGFSIKPTNENENHNGDDNTKHAVISGKRTPHPKSPTDDSCFETLPMNANLSRLAFSFNRMRPSDVQITGIAPAPAMKGSEIFHASLSSKCKTYEYRMSTGYLADPNLRKSTWHVGSSNLDLEKIQEACELLRGTHDFSAFQGAARGSEDKRKRMERKKNPSGLICTLYDLRIDVQHPVHIHQDYYFPGVDPPVQNYNVVVEGDRFLYKMVRFLVGSLVAVGCGKLDIIDIERAIETGNWEIPGDAGGKRRQFECAPAHGLTLTHIDYGDDISFDWQPLREAAPQRR